MTDEQAFLDLMKRFEIEPKKAQYDDGIVAKTVYEIMAKDQDKLPVQGYYNFYTHWTFDVNGKFVSLGIWE